MPSNCVLTFFGGKWKIMQIVYVVNPNPFSKSTTKAWNKPMFTEIYTHLFKTKVFLSFHVAFLFKDLQF